MFYLVNNRLFFIFMILLHYVTCSSLTFGKFKKRANEYLTCPVSSKIQSGSAVSGVECTLMCNKKINCMSVNYNRLETKCELLSFQSWVSSVDDTNWDVYHKQAECDGNWISHGIYCYLYIADYMTQEQARQNCLAMNSNLIYIDDDAENTFVSTLAMSQSPGPFWLGLSDIEVETVWKWSSGSTGTYTKFSDGEPSGGTEDCVVGQWGAFGEWNDVHCIDLFQSVCKRTVGE